MLWEIRSKNAGPFWVTMELFMRDADGYVLVFGAFTALLSTFARGDAWIALFIGILAMIWHALLRSGMYF